MVRFDEFWTKKALIGLGIGQFVSLLITSTGFTSSELARKGINAPTSQSFLNYVLLAIVYGSIVIYRRKPLQMKWYYYLILAFVDVEGNFLVVKAYQYTSLTSVMLLDCWTIPSVILLTWIFLKTKYRMKKFAGAAICVAGLVLVVFSDVHASDRAGGSSPIKGDTLVIFGAMLYAVANVSELVMPRSSRGRSPAMSADGAPPSYAVGYPSGSFPSHAIYGRRGEHYSNSNDPSPIPATPQFASDTSTEVAQVVREGGHRAIRQLITDAPFVKDASSTQPLRKSDFLFGDSVDDPEAVFIGAEHWLHKTGNGFIYLPEIPRHRSLTELRCQAVTREMSWRLTEDHMSVHCGYITHSAVPGSCRSRVTGLRPGVLGLDEPPRNEFLATASTLRNRLAVLGREMPASRHRFYGWVHSSDKSWWSRMTTYVLSRWGEELHACSLYAAVRATVYGLPVSLRHFCALFELYNPDSNTFLTRQGELGLALHEMHRISGLSMGQMLYQEYFPSSHELGQLKDRMPDRYETLWDLTCHYHIALAQSEPLAKRTKVCVSLKQFANYLFKNLESTHGEDICELAPFTPSEVNSLLKKIGAQSYTTGGPEGGFPAKTKFKSFLWHATAPIRPMTLLAGFLAIWLKKCVVPYQSGDALPLEVLYPAVQLAYKKELSLLPVMVANIHRGLRQLSSAFTRKETDLPGQIPTLKVELPYAYLMAWFVLHRSDMMSVPNATDHSVPLLQLLENGRWEGRGFSDVRQQLQVHKCWAFSTCFPQFSGRYGECLIDDERPREYRTYLDIGCFNWLVNIRPGYLTFRVRDQCFIEPYLPCRFARQFGYDQLYIGNPRQQLRTHSGLIDGLRAWLWTVTGCTGVRFSLPSADRQLNLTFLSCKWLLAANKTIPVKPIAELEAEAASQIDSRRIRENARAQRIRNKTRRIDEEGQRTFHSTDEASGGDPEDYDDFSERDTTVDQDEDFRPPPQARPSIPIARRKRLARKPRVASRASDMDLAGDDPISDRGVRGEDEMSPDPVPLSPDESDPLPPVEKSTGVADIREEISVGPDSVSQDNLQEANLGNEEADAPVRDFSIDDFDEGSLFADTPMMHYIYSSPQINDQLPGDMFPESAFANNPEDGSFEGAFVEEDHVEPAVRPTPPVDAATVVTSPSPPVTRGEGGLPSQLHILVKELLSGDDPEKIIISVEVRSYFSSLTVIIGKLLHDGLSLRQFKPYLDSKINLIRDIGCPDLATAMVDDLDRLERELQMFHELRNTGASSFVAAELDARLQTWRSTRMVAELEIQVQRDRIDRVEADFATRSSFLEELDSQIDQLRRELREKEDTKMQNQQANAALSDKLKSLKQRLAETEEDAVRTLAANEESVRAELQEELRRSYDEKLSEFSQQILSHGLDEFLAKNGDRVQLIAMLGLFGAIISAVQISILERKELKSITWTAGAILPFVGFSLGMFLFYSVVPILLKLSGSTMLNLSLLTSDMWAVLIRIFAYHEKVDWMYFLAFIAVAVGLVVYSWGEKDDETIGQVANETEEQAKNKDEEAAAESSGNLNAGDGKNNSNHTVMPV